MEYNFVLIPVHPYLDLINKFLMHLQSFLISFDANAMSYAFFITNLGKGDQFCDIYFFSISYFIFIFVFSILVKNDYHLSFEF